MSILTAKILISKATTNIKKYELSNLKLIFMLQRVKKQEYCQIFKFKRHVTESLCNLGTWNWQIVEVSLQHNWMVYNGDLGNLGTIFIGLRRRHAGLEDNINNPCTFSHSKVLSEIKCQFPKLNATVQNETIGNWQAKFRLLLHS